MENEQDSSGTPAGMTGTGRIEAFSDGVFAIAITLLILDVAVPARDSTPAGDLAGALGDDWPSYFAYLVSFLVIGIIWVNHHTLFAKVGRADRPVLFANLGLLFTVSVLPFPTHLLAEYLTAGANSHIAAAIYSGAMLAMGLAYSVLWLCVSRDLGLLHQPIGRRERRSALRRFGAGNIVYVATIGLSFVSAIAALAVHAAMALYYCFDQLSSHPGTGKSAAPEPGENG
jgi:uncharacterized membrane protein